MSNILHSLRPLAKTVPPPCPPVQLDPLCAALVMAQQELGWTQERLANAMGVHVRTVQRWLSGDETPRLKAIRNSLELLLIYSSRVTMLTSEMIRKGRAA